MKLSRRVSGKCLLILIPGEVRDVELEGVEIQDILEARNLSAIAVEFTAEDTTVAAPVGALIPAPPRIAFTIPAKIDTAKNWNGCVKLHGEPFCEFEVKLLNPEHAKALGWRNEP